MHSSDFATFSAVQVNSPLAAAPHSTPQMRGTHVTGFVSCSRIAHLLSVSAAPFMPSSCRASTPDFLGSGSPSAA